MIGGGGGVVWFLVFGRVSLALDAIRALWAGEEAPALDDWYRSGYSQYGQTYQYEFGVSFDNESTLVLRNSVEAYAGDKLRSGIDRTHAMLSLRSTPRRAAALAADAFSVDVDVQLRAAADRHYSEYCGLHAIIAIDATQSLYRQRAVYLDFFTGIAPDIVAARALATASAGFSARLVTTEVPCLGFINSSYCENVLTGNGINIPLTIGTLTTPWFHVHATVVRLNASTLAINASAWDSSRIYGTWTAVILNTSLLESYAWPRTLALGTGGASALFRNLVVRVNDSLALPPPPPPTTTPLTTVSSSPTQAAADVNARTSAAAADDDLPLLLAGAVALTLAVVLFAHAMVLAQQPPTTVVAAAAESTTRSRANSRMRRSANQQPS